MAHWLRCQSRDWGDYVTKLQCLFVDHVNNNGADVAHRRRVASDTLTTNVAMQLRLKHDLLDDITRLYMTPRIPVTVPPSATSSLVALLRMTLSLRFLSCVFVAHLHFQA